MILKKSVYPKTKRVGNFSGAEITEKLDGSNLVFAKMNGTLYICQRSTVISFDEVTNGTAKDILYKGLAGWLAEFGQILQDSIFEGSAVCGEWIGMGKISYGTALDQRFYVFGKARIQEDFTLTNLIYERELTKYAFNEQEIPSFMGQVPLVTVTNEYTITDLDTIYDTYVEAVGRHVEGFVINKGNSILKYVRMKEGKLGPHKT